MPKSSSQNQSLSSYAERRTRYNAGLYRSVECWYCNQCEKWYAHGFPECITLTCLDPHEDGSCCHFGYYPVYITRSIMHLLIKRKGKKR